MTTKSTYIAIATAAAVGAAAALLLAPASGKETRSKLMKQGKKLRSELGDLVNKGRDLADTAKTAARNGAAHAASKV
ncbi:MAG: YtxH domain-containing protein [Flavobacteriales bacterium]|nr:YtxH domain-containing protein [Flavobacteriales bacterium]